ATAGYGQEWEQRGRRHLAEPATALALRFPLARTGHEPAARAAAPRPAYLWVTVATVAAVAVSLLASGGKLPQGPATALAPPDTPAEVSPPTGPPSSTAPKPSGTAPSSAAPTSAPPSDPAPSSTPGSRPEPSRADPPGQSRPDPTVSRAPTPKRTTVTEIGI